MAIGSLGEITFSVSADQVRTFDELQRSNSARVTLHERQGGKPLAEFLGPDAEQITFNMRLSAFEGVAPLDEVKKLREMRDTGTAALFIFDGTPQGDGYWLITSLSEEYHNVDNRGCPSVIQCAVTLREYMERR